MKKWKINQTTCKHEDVFTKRKTQALGWIKTSPPTPLSKSSTSMNSCSTRMIMVENVVVKISSLRYINGERNGEERLGVF